MKVAFVTIGCRANLADTRMMAEAAAAAGHDVVAPEEAADVYVVNTCAVTHRADADGRSAVRQLAAAHPNARIVATGCLAETFPETLRGLGAVTVLGNAAKARAATFLGQAAPEDGALGAAPVALRPPSAIAALPFDRARPFLKIQDGCDRACTYCIVPRARGRSRSLPVDDVLQTLAVYGALGAEEVVLTAIHVGQYGRDLSPPTELAALLRRIDEAGTVARVRLSSIEPDEVSDALLAALAAPRFCRHLHLPLQSGDDEILARMGRPYRAADFAAAVVRVRAALPDAAVGADVIVGFPGESDAAFERTVRLVEESALSYLHVFAYSPRPGTPAAEFPDAVPQELVRRRSQRLRTLGEQRRRRFHASLVGREARVLVERRESKGLLRGLTEHFVPVLLEGPDEWVGRLVPAKLLRCDGKYVLAAATHDRGSPPVAAEPPTRAANEFEAQVGYRFRDPGLLEAALTHTSWRNEERYCASDNQRLEFLGDAVLGLVVSELLFRRFPDVTEGGLTRRRAALVSADALATVARTLALGDSLRLGQGETRSGGAAKSSILADGYEALLGAVYLDGGLAAATACVERHLAPLLARIADGAAARDEKSMLQEEAQARYRLTPSYVVVEEHGPPHARRFVIEVRIPGVLAARGEGESKKAAERAAAAAALTELHPASRVAPPPDERWGRLKRAQRGHPLGAGGVIEATQSPD